LENQFIQADLERWLNDQIDVTPKAQQAHQLHSRCALRCNIVRMILQEGYRKFAAHIVGQIANRVPIPASPELVIGPRFE
jgi:hypothetical protein